MDEKEEATTEGEEEKPTGEDSKDRVPVGTLAEQAIQAAKEIRGATAAGRKLLDDQQKFEAEKQLGGTTGGRVEAKVKTDDEKWAEDAKKRYEGTGMDPTPDDTPTTFQ